MSRRDLHSTSSQTMTECAVVTGRRMSRRDVPPDADTRLGVTFMRALLPVVIGGLMTVSGCGTPPAPSGQSASPAPSGQPASPAPSAAGAAQGTPSPLPSNLVFGVGSEHFLVDLEHPVMLPVDGAEATWPAAYPANRPPRMPDGKLAARFTLAPRDCPVQSPVALLIRAERSSDAWEVAFAQDKTITSGFAPTPTDATCWNGGLLGSYLDLGYYPLGTTITLAAQSGQTPPAVDDSVAVVAIYTSVDTEHPAFVQTHKVVVLPQPGAAHLLSDVTPRLVGTYNFSLATVPDGTKPNQAYWYLTGCGTASNVIDAPPIHVLIAIGNGPITDFGNCSPDGSASTGGWGGPPLPADGTQVRLYTLGGSSKTSVRISEFQSRYPTRP